MIVVGICVHLDSMPLLPRPIRLWDQPAHSGVRIVVVFNGRLRPTILRELAASVEQAAGPVEVIVRPNGHRSGFGPLSEAQSTLRRRTLQLRASHLLLHEVSRLPQDTSVLNELIAADGPIVGALYRDPYTLGEYCAFAFDPVWREHHSFGVVPEPLPAGPFVVPGIGFGFTLIRRDVLLEIDFRSGLHAADSFFAYDASIAGFTILAVPTIIWNEKVDGRPDVLAAWHEAHHTSPSYAS